jgi:predicted nucleic acid-binding protein
VSDKYFVDTNILIYAHDSSAGDKHRHAQALLQELWDAGNGVLSTQVLQELCVNLRRKVSRPVPYDELRRMVEDYMSWEVVVNGRESTIQALEIANRFKISYWDALVIYAAERSGANTLYSEDLAHRQKFMTVEVVNPFLRDPL